MGEGKQWIKEKDGSTTIPFEKNGWKSHDNFFGGEPYGGRIIVSYKKRPLWIMVYYGWIDQGVETNPVYSILRKALRQMPETAPLRGPKELNDGIYSYSNNWSGDIKKYSGEEKILKEGKLIYKANYMGGLVDQRVGV